MFGSLLPFLADRFLTVKFKLALASTAEVQRFLGGLSINVCCSWEQGSPETPLATSSTGV